nr:MFS transporter [Anaerolineae bacterium]
QNHTFRMIFIITFARLAPNMGRRVLYPFIPAISRLLGVGINDIQTIIAIQSGTGLFSPLATPLSRRFGRKRVMLGALALFIFAGTLGAMIGGFAMVMVAFVLFGIAKWVYDPAFQAYLSDKIPYEKRAQALGITELGWAFALVIGAPLTGILLENAGLSAVFWMMTAFAISAFILIALFLPSDKPDRTLQQLERMHIREIATHPQAIGVLLFVILFLTANEMFFINYGAWMDTNFGLSLGALGVATLVIALAEICGESIVIFYADKIGKKRMVMIGCGLSIVMHLILPMLNFNLGAALIGLFIIFFVFEIGIVSFLPIISEVLPNERALMMSASSSASAIGRVAGAWLGGMLYGLFGSLQSLSFITAAVGVVAMFILWRMVQEK